MLDRLPDWYRAVEIQQDDEITVKRKGAVTELVDILSAEDEFDITLIQSCVAGIVYGFDVKRDQTSPIVGHAITCNRKHSPAFANDLTVNGVELRVCCAVTLGELLSQADLEERQFPAAADVVASLLIAGLGFAPPLEQRHLCIVIEELHALARQYMDRSATKRRARTENHIDSLDEMPAETDVAKFWENFEPLLRSCLESIVADAASDREELDLLWWMFAGYSDLANAFVDDLQVGQAALYCGLEIADRVRLPPSNSLRSMVEKATSGRRTRNSLAAKALDQLLKQWKSISDHLVPGDAAMQQAIRTSPSLLPFSWLCLRLTEGGTLENSRSEFLEQAGIDMTIECEPSSLAVQVFDERIAQRIIQDTQSELRE